MVFLFLLIKSMKSLSYGMCSTTLAEALHFNTKLLQLETGRKFAAQLNGRNRFRVQVGNGAAAGADQMMMGMKIYVHAPGAV
jgi:hypothetical protein